MLTAALRSGSSRLDAKIMYATPITVAGKPTQIGAKKPRVLPVSFVYSPLTRRFVLVPISVHIPPRIVAYDKGNKSRLLLPGIRLLRSPTTGSIAATTGVLFRNALTAATGTSNRSWASRRVFALRNNHPVAEFSTSGVFEASNHCK